MKELMVGGEFVKLQKTHSYAYFKPVAFLTTSIKSFPANISTSDQRCFNAVDQR